MKKAPSASADSSGIEIGQLALEGERHLSKAIVVVSNSAVAGEGLAYCESTGKTLLSGVGSGGNNHKEELAQSRRRRDGARERGDTSLDMIRKAGISASLLNTPPDDFDDGDGQAERRRTRGVALRNDVAFWCLGLINNSSYVIMMAVAKDIAPSAVGVVFFAAVAPTIFIKVSAPYWFHLVPYSVRVCTCTVLMVLSLATVGYGRSTAFQLLGVCLSSLQGGLGEASFLALAAFYDTPRALTAWSSGTGFAGIFGYAWVFFLKFALGLSLRATLMSANLLPIALLYAYFRLLSDPHTPRSSITITSDGHMRDTTYSPLPSMRSPPSPSLSGKGELDSTGDDSERERWSREGGGFGLSPATGSALLDMEVEHPPAAIMTAGERLRFTMGLWRFIVPLTLVYFAEYTMQTGTWSAIGFPVTSPAARRRFYQYANWSYQGGVFVSRSSGMVLRISALALWTLPALQLLMLVFFYLVAVEQFWYDNGLLFLCFGVGLVGGLGYVNAFRLVAEAVPPELKELALASASVGDSFGVMFSDIFGTFVQACVYKRNGIPGAWATC